MEDMENMAYGMASCPINESVVFETCGRTAPIFYFVQFDEQQGDWSGKMRRHCEEKQKQLGRYMDSQALDRVGWDF
ncbi:uncharacterized protein G6M90_00g051580 [Metarhizium brunneum]|uniref:Uncharacterized protein n=1 Tax=Metarhizium brunneum TaxID=500148 RepID=A0A7D5Z2P2_9HYPO|nr:hypothetical protein G6M90_00g051580 [Metarhizium brunneum]